MAKDLLEEDSDDDADSDGDGDAGSGRTKRKEIEADVKRTALAKKQSDEQAAASAAVLEELERQGDPREAAGAAKENSDASNPVIKRTSSDGKGYRI